MPEFDRNAVVTIQGGGVYGLSLLGQLQGVIDHQVQPVALAGTSAGAVVASLYWAGHEPEAIREAFADLAGRPNGLVNLVGPFDTGPFAGFDAFRSWTGRLESYAEWARGKFPLGAARPGGRPLWWRLLRPLLAVPVAIAAAPLFLVDAVLAARDIGRVGRLVRARGVFPGRAFETLIDELLRKSPLLDDPALAPADGEQTDGMLTFGYFARVGEQVGVPFPPLFLTATNLRSRKLDLFDSTADEVARFPVARAVRASAGFPFFFAPVDVEHPARDDCYVDGGLICNFPAFVFSDAFRKRLVELAEEGRAEFYGPAVRPWVHVGLRLTDADRPHVAGELRHPRAFLAAVWDLATGAARTDLEGRVASLIARSVTVEQPFADTNAPPGGVLAIEGLTPRTVRTMFERGRRAAAAEFDGRSFELPDPALVEPRLAALVAQAALVFGDPENATYQLRSAVLVPFGDELFVRYRANMSSPADSDRDLRMPDDAGMAGLTLQKRQPHLCNLARVTALPPEVREERLGFDERLQAAVRADRTWLLTVPVLDPYSSYLRDVFDPDPALVWPADGASDAGEVAARLGFHLDGAVFAVLSLDATVVYEPGGLPADPANQIGDPRVQAVYGIMTATSLVLGRVFSDHFAQ